MALEDSGHCPLNIYGLKNQRLTRWNFKKVHWKVLSILSGNYIVEDLVDENLDLLTDCFVKGVLRAAHETILRGQVKRYHLFLARKA
ncbi:hypothetical protein CEXT_291191 [Caerostris extrusa]|uniref:Uncharacterized protein n=1 Tax=Caerostris extrusa TaxID=172846 RepID=A0AAV4VHU5_CAEEX|nr:hypothetical protein CEXT_291191 [Caerostris extrusa]